MLGIQPVFDIISMLMPALAVQLERPPRNGALNRFDWRTRLRE
jgi:hypothetical protein